MRNDTVFFETLVNLQVRFSKLWIDEKQSDGREILEESMIRGYLRLIVLV